MLVVRRYEVYCYGKIREIAKHNNRGRCSSEFFVRLGSYFSEGSKSDFIVFYP
jgi:hypothetical protein